MRIPAPINQGTVSNSTIGYIIHQYTHPEELGAYEYAKRYACGFPIPEFQREFCWTIQQQIAFIESVWLELPIGTFTHQELSEHFDPLSGALIDGQQRLTTIQYYITDQFPVFGLLYSQLTDIEKRRFKNIRFPHYETHLNNEDQLINLYNKLAYGGTPHNPVG